MDVMKFELKGKFGFFKKPDVNTYVYFTYGNIHKVALLGIFGAILGYKGYNQMSFAPKYKKDFKELADETEREYPEFYEKLNHLKIAIEPKQVSINKKVQVFNNSVGYASKEKGGNLIVKEQWLENPSWTIYIAIEDEEARNLGRALMAKQFVYLPYLGKNDHPANIDKLILMKDVEEIPNANRIDSLFLKDDFEIVEKRGEKEDIPIFKYEEKLPIYLDETTNKYELKSFIFTNAGIENISNTSVYGVGGKNIVFI